MVESHAIRLTVSGADADGEEISLTTTGTLTETGSGWSLEYEETNPNDMTVSETAVHCEGDRVTVSRTGTLLSTMVFDEHETFIGDYTTPLGNFQIRVLATELSVKRRGLVGHIHLVYQITLSTAFSSSDESTSRRLDIRFVPCRR